MVQPLSGLSRGLALHSGARCSIHPRSPPTPTTTPHTSISAHGPYYKLHFLVRAIRPSSSPQPNKAISLVYLQLPLRPHNGWVMTPLSGGGAAVGVKPPSSPFRPGPPNLPPPPVMETFTAVSPSHLQERPTVNVVIYGEAS